MSARKFIPAYLDHYQASAYRHVATTVEPDGSLVAHFADGSTRPSFYKTVEAMLAAGESDWRERMVEVSEPKQGPLPRHGRRMIG